MANMKQKEAFLLLVVVCIIATCGLVYELVAGTLASYIMGDSVKQFSFIIGIYLFAMGLGAYISDKIKQHLFEKFIQIEYLVGIIGGTSSLVLLSLFQFAEGFQIVLFSLVGLTGMLVGIEVPILMRLLKHSMQFEAIVSRVLTFDYLGALFASIIFPLLCIPYLGLSKTSLFFGLLNVLSGLFTAYLFRHELRKPKYFYITGIINCIVLLGLFISAEQITGLLESQQFPGKIIYAKSTAYQRMVVTRNREDIRLFLNGNLQFSSVDEHRYHEALVHPAMQGALHMRDVLILGGGDGLALREVLQYPEVKNITLVDLDPGMIHLFTTHPALVTLNKRSLLSTKATVINDDAMHWLLTHPHQFDCIIVDFPDPSNFAIGKLYSSTFYKHLSAHLRKGGWAVVQCTSPYAAPQAFWTIDTTIRSVGMNTIPYYNMVPSFGIWGYILCSHESAYSIHRNLPVGRKYYDTSQLLTMRTFPHDMLPKHPLQVNKLNNQVLVSVFEEEWDKYLQ